MKKIPLTQGKFALVDDADFELLSQHKWYFIREGYAVRTIREGSKNVTIRMHRVVARTPECLQTDHINGNRLDNRRSNLRVCSVIQNQQNRDKQRNNTSGFKGVYYDRRRNRWGARISINKKSVNLGYFDTPQNAASAYREVALRRHGDFAHVSRA